MKTLEPLREAMNVDDLKNRDRLVRRLKKMRSEAVIDKHTLEYWNRGHPSEQPFSTDFEDSVIAWCDGKGPMPENCAHCAMNQLQGFVINGACDNPNCPKPPPSDTPKEPR